MAVLMISISHRCNSPGASLRDSFSGESLSAMPTKMGDLTNLSPNLHHVQKIMQMNWLLIWKTQRLGDINQRKNMQTKVTVIPILVHKWRSCDFPPPPLTVYLYSSGGSEEKMEILYILKPPALIIFYFSSSPWNAGWTSVFFFFSFFTHSAALPSNYNNTIMTSCWFFHYHIKLKKKKKSFQITIWCCRLKKNKSVSAKVAWDQTVTCESRRRCQVQVQVCFFPPFRFLRWA